MKFITRIKIEGVVMGMGLGEMIHEVADVLRSGTFVAGDGFKFGMCIVIFGLIIHWIRDDRTNKPER